MPESETQMESVNESLRIDVEDELHVVDNVIKKESSVLDELLSVASVESTPGLDGNTKSGVEQKEVTISEVMHHSLLLNS